MPVPSNISDLSQTAGSNSPAGSESPTLLDDYHRTTFAFIAKLRDGQGFSNPVDLASAATTDIGAQTSPFVRITGTTTITSFGANYNGPRFLTFAGALTLTHNSTSLILPGGANITTAAGDSAIVAPNLATPNGWRVLVYSHTTASAAFDAIKQAATSSATGVVELATDAEAQAGADAIRAVTPANLAATVLGLGQTWQDVSGSRAFATNYTNSTGRSIQVSVTCTSSFTGGNAAVGVLIDGVTIANYATNESNGATYQSNSRPFSFIVPPGSVYRVNQTLNTSTIGIWAELR